MSGAPKFPRRQWIVEPTYQWRITRLLVVSLLAVVICTLVLIYLALWATLGELELWPTAVFIASFKAVAWLVIVELVALVPLVVIAGILFTHRIVGPVGRISAALERIGKGEFGTRLKLRDGDVLEDVAASINRMAEALQKGRGR
jgi:methyl-accepting chemotaxis protein